jgi:hypothetical protein
MKQSILIVLAAMLAGCDEYTLVPEPSDQSEECIPTEVTNTRVYSERFDAYIILRCTVCDVDECNSLGARCDAEGAPCDFYGKLGVCRGCCDSEFGELHCALESY